MDSKDNADDININSSVGIEKRGPGRPAGSGAKQSRMARVILTPRQDRLLRKLRAEWGLSESEHIRRAIDLYLDGLLASGEITD